MEWRDAAMESAVVFFWLGLAALLLAAFALAWLGSGSRAARAHPASSREGEKLVHTLRRGRIRLRVRRGAAPGCSRALHHVEVEPRGPNCEDCMRCVNQAIRWIREHETPA